ncbi:hypothetical protein CPB86DRAFT_684152, partial [Serendipita vermifera]
MLERRNLLTVPSIRRIKKISMHSLYPIYIFRIIRGLLGCKWVKRPSNKELSLAGNAEIIMDLSLPGCYRCHRRLQTCSMPVPSNQKPSWRDLKSAPVLKNLMEYPSDEDEILATW